MKYEGAYNFSEGLAAVKFNGKWGFIDSKGKEAIPFGYEGAKYFEGGYAAAKQNGNWGVINKENKTILAFMYDDIVWIKDDANDIRVKKGNKYFHVDRQGNELKK